MPAPDPATVRDGRLLAMWQQLTWSAGMGGVDPPAGYGWAQGLAPALPDGSYVVAPQTFFTPGGGDDAVWIQNALTQAAQLTGGMNGGKVRLMPLNYQCQSMITMPGNSALIGAFPVQADSSSNYGAGSLALQGTILTATGPFSQPSPPAAVIQCSNTTGTQQGGQVIQNLSIEGNQTPAGSGVFCILLHGAVGAGVIDNVVLHRSDGACLRVQTDSGTGKAPDQWRVNRMICSASRSSHGVLIDNAPDWTFTDCLSHNNNLNGWDISGSTNTHFLACRGENAGSGNGFAFHGQVSAAEDTWLTGCTTQLNELSGFLFDAAAHANVGQYTLTGCRSGSDGLAASGILAGFYDNGCKSAVVLTGCTTLKNAGGTVPAYGAYEALSGLMALTGCRMQGVTASTGTDTTGTLSNLVPVPF